MPIPKVPPPCWDLFDAEALVMEPGHSLIEFQPKPEHENPFGQVQGGLLAAMMDNCIGPAVYLIDPTRKNTTAEMKITYLEPAGMDVPLRGEAKVLRSGRSVAFVEVTLSRPDGTVVARASATNIYLGKSPVPSDLDEAMNQH